MKIIRSFGTAALLSAFFACASVAPPNVDLSSDQTYYISPRNGDGIQDSLSVSVDIQIDPRSALSGYTITVLTEDGIVRRPYTR